MSNEDSIIYVFIFIARSDKEFKQFRLSDAVDDNNHYCKWRYSPDQKLLRVVINKFCEEEDKSNNWLGNNGWELLNPTNGIMQQKLKSYFDETDSYEKVKIESYIRYNFDIIFDNIIRKINSLINNVLIKIDSTVRTKFSPCIFIHWGGVGEDDYEKYEDFVRNNIFNNKENKYQGWRFYSYGTYRNHLFQIDEKIITIPKNLEEFQSFELKFKKDSEKNIIKNILMENFINAENVQTFTTNIYDQLIRDFINAKKVEWTKRSLPSKEREFRFFLIDQYNSYIAKSDPSYIEGIKRLFSIILQDEDSNE